MQPVQHISLKISGFVPAARSKRQHNDDTAEGKEGVTVGLVDISQCFLERVNRERLMGRGSHVEYRLQMRIEVGLVESTDSKDSAQEEVMLEAEVHRVNLPEGERFAGLLVGKVVGKHGGEVVHQLKVIDVKVCRLLRRYQVWGGKRIEIADLSGSPATSSRHR